MMTDWIKFKGGKVKLLLDSDMVKNKEMIKENVMVGVDTISGSIIEFGIIGDICLLMETEKKKSFIVSIPVKDFMKIYDYIFLKKI